jgi:hypothetical protein
MCVERAGDLLKITFTQFVEESTFPHQSRNFPTKLSESLSQYLQSYLISRPQSRTGGPTQMEHCHVSQPQAIGE